MTLFILALAVCGRSDTACDADDSLDELRSLGLDLSRRGSLTAALKCFQTAVKSEPSDAPSWHDLAEAQRRLSQHDAAERSYRRVLGLHPRSALAYFNLGNTLKELGRLQESVDAYQTALDLRPKFTTAVLNNLALSLSAMGRFAESAKRLV